MQGKDNIATEKIVKHTQHKLVCDNRRLLCITGVEKASEASPTHFSCVVMGRELQVDGKDLQVNKLDVNEGVAEIEGEIDAIKYAQERKSIFKRLFR